jgi:hypothetical protein
MLRCWSIAQLYDAEVLDNQIKALKDVSLGYQPMVELSDEEERQSFGLEPQPAKPGPVAEKRRARPTRPSAPARSVGQTLRTVTVHLLERSTRQVKDPLGLLE